MIYYIRIYDKYIKIKVVLPKHITTVMDHTSFLGLSRIATLIVTEDFKVLKSRGSFTERQHIEELSILVKAMYLGNFIDLSEYHAIDDLQIALDTIGKMHRARPTQQPHPEGYQLFWAEFQRD